ncbi:diaminopimelate decarboxylase [Sphaerisporangium sp. B11E5]|uniref:diaminopimelate decarboxylase n=1 Tax=Sphaerisporangium sp. B11E5 TaxID=3153563 RepID=UPI00325EF1B4
MRLVGRESRTERDQPGRLDAGPWPSTFLRTPDGDATLGGVSLCAIAGRFGTPSYVMDETDVRRRARAYKAALPDATIAYAAKAFLCRAMADWIRTEGLSLDVCSGGELALARSVGFPGERIIFHGNAKTPHELHEAVEYGVGRVVLDNLPEIARLAVLVPLGKRQKVLLRIVPDVLAGAHAAIRTGGEGQKFGLSLVSGDAATAVHQVLGQPGLELAGLHCHIGSQITTVEPFQEAARVMVRQLAHIRDTHGVVLPELDLGGGHGIAYLPGDHPLDPRHYAAAVTSTIHDHCTALGLPAPRLTIEPGRAVSGPAGITLYRVIVVKRQGSTTFVAVDGGMSDNPRPSLYGAPYTMSLIGRRTTPIKRRVTVVGRHCESGDVIAENVPMPADIHPGDLIAVAATGAYNHSMASTYNLTTRPPVIAISEGTARLVVRREAPTDLLSREVGL